jgi:hypothetical protein
MGRYVAIVWHGWPLLFDGASYQIGNRCQLLFCQIGKNCDAAIPCCGKRDGRLAACFQDCINQLVYALGNLVRRLRQLGVEARPLILGLG